MMLELSVFDLNLFFICLSNLPVSSESESRVERLVIVELDGRFKTRSIVFGTDRQTIIAVYRLANYHNLQFKSTSAAHGVQSAVSCYLLSIFRQDRTLSTAADRVRVPESAFNVRSPENSR